MIDFQCPHCGKTIRTQDSDAGRLAKCRKCGGRIKVPKRSEPTAGGSMPSDSWFDPEDGIWVVEEKATPRRNLLKWTAVGGFMALLGLCVCGGLFKPAFDTQPPPNPQIKARHITSLRDWQTASDEDKLTTVSVVASMRPHAAEVIAFVDSFCAEAERDNDPNRLLDKKDVAEVAAMGMVMIEAQGKGGNRKGRH
jgi:DNA-directed RNA polymerase subunit RPC12/RpoP